MRCAGQHLGIGPGDVVGILSPNDIHYFTAFHGIGLSGAASTTINPTYTEEEIRYQLEITEAKAVVGKADCIAPSFFIEKSRLFVQ